MSKRSPKSSPKGSPSLRGRKVSDSGGAGAGAGAGAAGVAAVVSAGDSKGDSKSGDGDKQKLATSEKIFNRIRWDKDFDVSEYTVVYDDHLLGEQELPVSEFRIDKTGRSCVCRCVAHSHVCALAHTGVTNVPFHRVWRFKRNGEVVWDREKRIDLIGSDVGKGADKEKEKDDDVDDAADADADAGDGDGDHSQF
jgi:uncharacterized protein (UPF0248 family)